MPVNGERRFQVNSAQVLSTSTFFARQMLVSNLLPQWLYFRIGGSDIPTAANADLSVPPLTVQLIPLPTTNMVAVGLGPVLVTLGQQVATAQNAVVTLYESASPIGIGSIDLNPSRLGQSIQQTFTVASGFTLTFPASQVHVQNYTGSWVYIATGTLVTPTASNAMASVPPMTERSLPCPPSALFAFGFSSDLTTKGQQVPAGIRVVATFYEYPTPVSIGTANLNPTRLGNSVSTSITASSVIDPAFPVAQINVSNYLQKWIYATYGQANRILNPDLEDWPGALPTSWAFAAGAGGTCVQGAAYRGSFGAKITKGAGGGNDIFNQPAIPVTPGEVIALSFWYMTDGINAPAYYVYNQTGAAFIIPITVLATPTVYTQFRVEFTVPALCVSIQVSVLQRIAEPAGAIAWFDTFCFQLASTAANAQIAVPPMSEKSITLPPSTHVDIVVGTQTVMAATALPITSCLLTLYEYAVPVNLGAAPLSPGGFRTRINLRTAQNLNNGDTISVDLSNFTYFRYSINAPAGPAVRWGIVIYALLGGSGYTLAALPPMRAGGEGSCVGNAGTIIQIQFITDTNPVSVTDIIEAWS